MIRYPSPTASCCELIPYSCGFTSNLNFWDVVPCINWTSRTCGCGGGSTRGAVVATTGGGGAGARTGATAGFEAGGLTAAVAILGASGNGMARDGTPE